MTSLQQMKTDYDNDGVIRVRQLFDGGQMKDILAALTRYIQVTAPRLTPGDVTFEADGQSVRNLWRMEKHDPFFAGLAKDPQLLERVGLLLGGQPVLVGVETFNKPAKVGSGVPPHQDNAYFCQTPADVLTVWIAVDAVTDANGPVFYARGSHKLGMLPHRPSGVKGNSMGLAAPFEKDRLFTGTLEPGDALIHHCQTIHYSAPNRTDHARCGLLLVYRAAHTQYDPALQAAYAQGGAIAATGPATTN